MVPALLLEEYIPPGHPVSGQDLGTPRGWGLVSRDDALLQLFLDAVAATTQVWRRSARTTGQTGDGGGPTLPLSRPNGVSRSRSSLRKDLRRWRGPCLDGSSGAPVKCRGPLPSGTTYCLAT